MHIDYKVSFLLFFSLCISPILYAQNDEEVIVSVETTLIESESVAEEEGEANRAPASLPMAQYTIELLGRRSFQTLSTFSEKLLGSIVGESRLVKKLITQDKVVYELNVSQELTAVRDIILGIRTSLPQLTLKGVEGERIMLEFK